MKPLKITLLGILILAICLLSYVVYKQRPGFIQSIWFIYKRPSTIHGITGRFSAAISQEYEQYPWNGRSLQPLFNDMRPLTLESDYEYLQNHIQTGGLNITQMALLHISEKNMMREEYYLKYPPLQDILQLPNETFSKVKILNPKDIYDVGDTVRIRVDLYNGYNKRLFRGGDIVRLWIRESSKDAGMAVPVQDMESGSYLADVPVMWEGLQQVRVSVRYPREMVRPIVFSRHIMKSLRYVAAGFLKKNASESTLCLPFPRVPGYNKLCNFTKRNYGNSWYCGYPRKRDLHCSDWKILRDLEFPDPLPLTMAEQMALEIPNTDPVPRLLKQMVFIQAGPGRLPPVPRCDRKNYTHTWIEEAPHGFYMNKMWIPTTCSFPVLSLSAWASCLANTTVILAGDSNLLMWLHRLKSRVNCQITKMRSSNDWHTPLLCRRPDINFSMVWQLHGYPEHPTSSHWADITHFRSACDRIDQIPAHGKYVVIVHLFIHFSIHHPCVLTSRLRCIRRAIVDLLARNPTTKIFIRAPFTASKGWNPVFGGDTALPFFLTILRNEFKGLYDRVIFLNMWDMTVAGENTDYHPDAWIDHQMAGIVLGHICNN